jgi:hypothetical protein
MPQILDLISRIFDVLIKQFVFIIKNRKITAIFLSILTIQYFFSIFIICTSFYQTNEICITLLISILLAVNWYLVSLLVGGVDVIVFMVNEKFQKWYYYYNGSRIFLISSIFSILVLSFSIFLIHYLDLSFLIFLLIIYGVCLIRIIIDIILILVIKFIN